MTIDQTSQNKINAHVILADTFVLSKNTPWLICILFSVPTDVNVYVFILSMSILYVWVWVSYIKLYAIHSEMTCLLITHVLIGGHFIQLAVTQSCSDALFPKVVHHIIIY